MQKITTFLCFDRQAEQAATFYVSLFDRAQINRVVRYTDAVPERAGTVLTVEFELEGQAFVALNGCPDTPFTQAISFQVDCATQEEVDTKWARLAEGGEEGQCGWVKDRFGLWWQVTPTILGQLMSDPDTAKAARVTEALLKMTKIDSAALLRAAESA